MSHRVAGLGQIVPPNWVKLMNHSRVRHLSMVKKALQRIALSVEYKLIWLVYMDKNSFRSVTPS